MQPAPQLFPGTDTRLETATVNSADNDAYMVNGPSGAFRALRAAGCLLAPERGDKVLLALCPRDAYILCVLARTSCSDSTGPRMVLPADTTLEAPGHLRVQADELELEGREHLSLHGRVLHCAGEVLTQTFVRLETTATHMQQTIGRCFAFFGKRVVEVEGSDEVKAGRMRLTSQAALRIRAENASVRAEKNLEMDGDRINIG